MRKNIFSIFKKRNNPVNSYATTGFGSTYDSPVTNRRRSLGFGKLQMSKQVIAIVVIAIIALAAFGIWFKRASDNVASTSVLGSTSLSKDPNTIAPPYATMPINREFSFPLTNSKGDKVSEFKYIIDSAELAKEIVVQQQKVQAVKGRAFLVLNLKVVNDGKQQIEVNTKDYMRLTVENSPESLAPDIHNDPVKAQPISTKPTRVGFAVDEGVKHLKLQVGEIAGEKQYIDINF